jgi:ribosomal protein S18 acetylase RimI-like enzyme
MKPSTMASQPDGTKHDINASPPSFYIHAATSEADLVAIATCFREYTEWLGQDLTFQNYASELASLPGKYAPAKGGALLLARDTSTDQVLGCVALRALQIDTAYLSTPNRQGGKLRYCEIKRLYVRPAGRRRGIARALVREVLEATRGFGYDEAVLDTLEKMTSAIGLYRSEGFVHVKPYYHNPIDGCVFLAKVLKAPS